MHWHLALKFKTLTAVILFSIPLSATCSDSSKVVFKFDIKSEITPGAARTVSRALDQAVAHKADYVIIDLNTYGGMLDAADSIRTALLNSSIPSIVFIDNNAASAGALISIACNRIYMRSGSSIGAATVVDQAAKALPDKYQSYMRSMMRSTAEKRGRNPKIAEAMVDPRTYIPGINDSGKVLTFTASEALANGYCDGMAETLPEVLAAESLGDAQVIEYHSGTIDKIINWLMNPAISGMLILVIIGGIYFEMQTPGVGFPLIAACVAALLYFAPLYLEGLASNWEVLVILAGFVLIALEIFVIPGFGVSGVSGIALVMLGFILTLLPNEGFDFTFAPAKNIYSSVTTVLASITLSIILMFVFGGRLIKSRLFGRLILQDEMKAEHGFSTAAGAEFTAGMKAIAYSDLRPSGKIMIQGKVYSAVAESYFIPKGTPVTILETDGIKITVTDRTL
ncbi:MAG: nodulation protein NfeD [Bacteroidia bacterium]|nr:nodulation protein NfeD [Bacteroidia bacterium]MCZ2276866.1 nodulation protein NfeD [Bacteroidia bacterium]